MRALAGLFLLASGITLLAGCDDDVVVAIDPVLEVSPRHLDFGTVELGQDAVLPVKIRNLEKVKGVVQLPEILDNCDGCFISITPYPIEVPGFAEVDAELKFRAVRLETATATATIRTDDPKAPMTTVTMIGRGSDMRKP
jgi:hypothetical protein